MAKEKDESAKKCAETGTSLRRAKRYYRNGKYFKNRVAFKAFQKKELEAAKEAEAKTEG